MILRLCLMLAAVFALSGCHRREISKLERDEAANMVSEADFAMTLKEWSRAEDLYAKAVKLCPDAGDTWVNLGVARMHQNNSSGARSAYKSALSAFKDDYEHNPAHTQSLIHRVYVLVILGRADEGRSLIETASAGNPNDRLLRAFVENKTIDKMLADPGLKSLSP
jgi:tetratricopeptide (TPR) repeat protein